MSTTEPGALRRFGHWCLGRGWVHLLLLSATAVFIYPLLWMAFTSVKTDEELAAPGVLPPAPRFHAVSPYVRDQELPAAPEGVSAERWAELVPHLISVARAAVDQLAPADPPVERSAWVWAAALNAARAAAAAVERAAWQGPAVEQAVSAACSPAVASAALDQTLAHLDIEGLELITDDAQLYQLIGPEAIAMAMTVAQGHASATPSKSGALVRYDFGADPSPVVLSIPFALPAGVAPGEVHRLTVQMRMDDSWHTVTAELDLGGRTLRSTMSTPLAQNRESPIAFQPPSFDDTTYRARTWVALADSGPSATPADVLRLTIHPSSAARVAWERVARNYVRAVQSVPFWTYLANSALLVFLVVSGSMLSSAFVAYAFAQVRAALARLAASPSCWC